jgi:glycosyltransferase involved in cell wall biosynthesis
VSAPLVSIGCAVYNGEATLERALATLTGQSYRNIEIIISDDGSSDRTMAICEAAARQDPRVRLLTNASRLGLTRNFNRVFAESSGQYFMWADQDDVRDPTFVEKAVAVLEADPGVVLCHGRTAVFRSDPDDVKLIVTLSSTSGVASPLRRYWRFLREYADTTIYGLIRADVLRQTRLWRSDLGAANALLFELLQRGTFVEIPEVLYFYAGRGLRNRPAPRDEYARMHTGRPMPWYYQPFLVLATNQSRGIRRSPLPWPQKAALFVMLWAHVLMVAATKLGYRLLDRLAAGRLPLWLTQACNAVVDPQAHLIFVNNVDGDREHYPRYWVLRGRS